MEDRGRCVALLGWSMAIAVAIASTVEASPNEYLQAAPLVAASLHARAERSRARAESTTVAVPVRPRVPERPALLLPLYVGFAGLQAADAHSTVTGVQHGLVEANPLMAGAAHSSGAVVAMKVATTASTIVGAELLWRRHRAAAVITMALIDGAYAAVVAHNYRMLR